MEKQTSDKETQTDIKDPYKLIINLLPHEALESRAQKSHVLQMIVNWMTEVDENAQAQRNQDKQKQSQSTFSKKPKKN